jgi:hypothetical protein
MTLLGNPKKKPKEGDTALAKKGRPHPSGALMANGTAPPPLVLKIFAGMICRKYAPLVKRPSGEVSPLQYDYRIKIERIPKGKGRYLKGQTKPSHGVIWPFPTAFERRCRVVLSVTTQYTRLRRNLATGVLPGRELIPLHNRGGVGGKQNFLTTSQRPVTWPFL